MTHEEVFTLLAYLSRAFPSFTIADGMVGVWHGVLTGLNAAEVEQAALTLARAGNPFAPAPGEIRDLVMAGRRDRAARTRALGPPPVDPADGPAYRAALASQRRAAGDAHTALPEGHRP